MIVVENLNKSFRSRSGRKNVLNNINFTLQLGARLGITGNNGSGKSTLIKIIAGAEQPTSGRVYRKMRTSWPLAFSGGFQGSLSGIDNAKFIARIYNAEENRIVAFVRSFSELGNDLKEPVKTYSSGMQARLAFALTMALDFDCILIDEVISVGDAHFQEKCRHEILEKRKNKSIILVSHHPEIVTQYCNQEAILTNGSLKIFG
jgi:capsular polysaccharide transport system ATP-binding protein